MITGPTPCEECGATMHRAQPVHGYGCCSKACATRQALDMARWESRYQPQQAEPEDDGGQPPRSDADGRL